MKTMTNKTWKMIAAFTMALTIMCGAASVMGNRAEGGLFTVAAAETAEEPFVIQTCENGTIQAQLVEGSDQEFNAILVTATPAAGYKLDKVFANGEQVAINDQGEYLIAYTGETVTLSAEFAAEETEAEAFEILPCENGTIQAQLVEGSDQEFNAILVTATPAAGYKLDKVFANGEQVAINDKGEYLIAYTGKKVTLSAEFVKAAYSITVKDAAHGKVKTDKATAGFDEAVLITATPDNGYKVDKVLVNGQQIAINDKGQYLIAMPAGDITVTAEFVASSAAPAAKGDTSPKTGAAAAVGLGSAAVIAAASLMMIKRRK